ncbi:Skm1p [Rhizophagus irregularis DAOM 197198w]|uniref:Skm1p n=2 Tax=Rhizophagus irregularis TaxID=588596 RepID=A0A015K7G9_RHIIW|nr:Skm1p [Rhizophagus irregularis DAOM 197198w]
MSFQDSEDNKYYSKYLKKKFTNKSGNEQIDNFIQEMQLKIKDRHDIVLEWIPYEQFDKIIETNKNGFVTVYSAIWKDGPLYKNWWNNKYTRDTNKEIILNCLYYSQYLIEFLINKIKKYVTDRTNRHKDYSKLYGISRNPDTNDYILVQSNSINLINWISGNEKIDNFIQEIQEHQNIVFEWIPYGQFNEINKTGKNGFMTVYSAIWKNGPLNYQHGRYKRDPNKEIALKYLHNSQDPVESIINEVKKHLIKKSHHKNFKIYGISQNPNTNDFILVQNNSINLINWISGNEKINEFIQEMQLKTNNLDIVFEWIPYNQFNEINETGKNGFMTVYSAIWKDGPLNYQYGRYKRDPNKEISLKCLHNSQDPVESLINEVKKHLVKKSHYKNFETYGISQNSDTNEFIIVQNNLINLINWVSSNDKIDDFIQEMYMKIVDYNDIVFEWIPYNQFYQIKEIGNNGFMIAIWKDGPLYYSEHYKEYTRDSNKEVTLVYLYNSQDPIKYLINEVYTFPKNIQTKNYGKGIGKIYGISQNPDKSNYILVLSQISENEKVNDFIQEMQLNVDDLSFEWIPYNQFNEIKEIGKGGFATIYSAIWKDGPLKSQDVKYNRDSNKKVALKCLNNSQNINRLLNEVRAYSTKADEYERIIKVYGISQDPDTKNYIIVLHYAAGGDFNNWINKNENYKYFNWKSKVRTLYNIASGLKVIHKKQMVHHDFHTGNVLFNTTTMKEYANKIYISDMGLCGGVDDINQNNIYGVMPYIAPEVLRGKPYTQAADIYSFGMIMYFAATGRQPFDDCAHDHYLALDICNGIRPIINEPEAPKSYIDLMKKCLDSNPENRPDIDKLSKLLWSVTNIKSEIEKAENYRNLQLSSLKGDRQIITHPQAIYTSRLLNQFTKDLPKYDNSECLDCAILD